MPIPKQTKFFTRITENWFSNDNSANFHLTNSIISFLILFYASAKIFTELKSTLNRIYKVKITTEKNQIITFVEKQIISLILVSITCLSISMTLIVNFTLNKLSLQFHDDLPDIALLHTLNNLASVVILGGIFLASYKFLPSRKIKWKSALVGTAVGILLFEIGKYVIALYLSLSMIIDFYGSMGSLVMLMFWVYYTVEILLIGAECAIEFETTQNT